MELLNAREFDLPMSGFQFESAIPISGVMTMLFNCLSFPGFYLGAITVPTS